MAVSRSAFCADAVLIVEDDDAAAELMRRALTRSAIVSVTARSVCGALALLQHHSFSAILLDYQLPDGGPWAIVEAAAALRPAVPVILVTGQGSEAIAGEAIRRGVADYVMKSGSFWEQLPAILNRVTRLAESRNQLRDEDAQNELLATMSHEIRTPLNRSHGVRISAGKDRSERGSAQVHQTHPASGSHVAERG